jgi:hypothetical protein
MTRRTIPGSVYHTHLALAALDREGTEQRVRTLAATGLTDHDISHLTGLHVEQVRRILAGPSLNLERD